MKRDLVASAAISGVIVLLSFFPGFALAQQTSRTNTSIIIDTDLIITRAQVLDEAGRHAIKGLKIDDFLLLENSELQNLTLFKDNQPVSAVFLIDGMVCIWPKNLEIYGAARSLDQLERGSEFALMGWDSDVAMVLPFTTDQNLIGNRLSSRVSFFNALNGPLKQPRPTRTWYRPGEAIYQAAKYLDKYAKPTNRKVIIVLAWKRPPLILADTHQHSAMEVLELLDRTGTTVYGLYLQEGNKRPGLNPISKLITSPRESRQRSGGTLEQFVEHTAGSIHRGQQEDASKLFDNLIGLIGTNYTIGYYPKNTDFDGKFRRIDLRLSPSGKAKAGKAIIKNRNGYRAIRSTAIKIQ